MGFTVSVGLVSPVGVTFLGRLESNVTLGFVRSSPTLPFYLSALENFNFAHRTVSYHDNYGNTSLVCVLLMLINSLS